MPTWTNANGQDDLVWHQASVSGDTATFYVPSSAHKGESGCINKCNSAISSRNNASITELSASLRSYGKK